MNKALEKLKKKAQDSALYKLSADERSKNFNESIEKINLSKEDYIYIKDEFIQKLISIKLDR